MEERLDRLRLDYQVIPAVDGSKLTQDQWDRYSPSRARRVFGRELSVGEIGCSLSHALLYDRMVREGTPEVLILEDDVIVTKDLLQILSLRDRLPEDWQVVNFDLRPYRVLGKRRIFVGPLGGFVWKDYRACVFERVSAGTAAYLLSLEGAKRLVRKVWPICVPSDVFIGRADMSKAIVYGVYPPAVKLAKTKSTIYLIDGGPRWQGTTNSWLQSKKVQKTTRYLYPPYFLSAVRRETCFGIQRMKGRPLWSKRSAADPPPAG